MGESYRDLINVSRIQPPITLLGNIYTGYEELFHYHAFRDVMNDIDNFLDSSKRRSNYRRDVVAPLIREVVVGEIRVFRAMEGYPFTTNYSKVLARFNQELGLSSEPTESGGRRFRFRSPDEKTRAKLQRRIDRYLGILTALVEINRLEGRGEPSAHDRNVRQMKNARYLFSNRYPNWDAKRHKAKGERRIPTRQHRRRGTKPVLERIQDSVEDSYVDFVF